LLSGNTVDQSHSATTAACDWLQQRWLSMIKLINHSHCPVEQDDATLPFAPPFPLPPMTHDPAPLRCAVKLSALTTRRKLQMSPQCATGKSNMGRHLN